MKSFGHFSDDGLEYVVTTPHTPNRDWFNFFWNPTYLAAAGQSMNGLSLYQSEKGVVTNLFGKQDVREGPRWLYIRDNATGEFWSSGYFPCWTEHDEFECRHGLGYSILRTLKNGIRVEFRLFVPRDYSGEIWTVRLSNESRRARDLSLFSVADIVLDGVNMPYGYLGGLRAAYSPKEGFLFYQNTTYTVVEEKYRAFMYADVKPNRWDTSRDHFLGRYRSMARPERVVEGRLGNSVASVECLVGAMQHNFRLKPGASRTINIVLGLAMDIAEARRMKNAFADGRKIEKEFLAMKREKVQRLGGLKLETPDKDFNRLFSVWLKHQLYLMSDWARFYFKGYRDTCQDAAGMSVINPTRSWEMLKKALRHQRSDGFCPRAFRVPSMDIASADKHYADSPSWISHATDALIRETGDLSLLDKTVEYSDKGKGTLWQHNLKAMEFLWNDRGRHGLSLLHCGDWNDCIDKAGARGIGEGIWMSMALARVLKLTGQLAAWRGDRDIEQTCARRFDQLKKAIWKHGWDKDHFIYAINDDGQLIGSSRCREGRFFINPQSWAMLSGVADAATYSRIAKRLEPIVDTPVGPVHHWPPYTKFDPGIGQLSGTPPGYGTNGNVYCHAASFKVAADFEAGRADKAFDSLSRIIPNASRSEPYAQTSGYVGPSALRMNHHFSDDPWRTGTVGWNFLNVVDRMLGFRRTLKGFHLRPRLPSIWSQVRFVRPFRGTNFEIHVRRGKQARIRVEGKPIEGDFIAVPKKGLGKAPVHIVCEVKS